MAIRTGWVGSSAKAETGQAWMSPARTRVRLPAAGWMSEMVGRSVEIIMRTVRDTANMDIYTYFGRPTQAAPYILYIDHQMYSNSAGNPAMTTGVFPAGSTLELRIYGAIRGAGGNAQARSNSSNGTGQNGGDALLLNFPTKIDNSRGYIYAGGGGGGSYAGNHPVANIYATGGGGAGTLAGLSVYATGLAAGTGASGTATTGGRGGNAGGDLIGGKGGDLGQAGARSPQGSAGGAAGRAVVRNGHAVTWLGGNNTTRVKGSIV